MELGKKSWSYFQRGNLEVRCKNFICEQNLNYIYLYSIIFDSLLATNTADALCSFDIVVVNNIIIV